jgi:hypothetical protein
MFLGMRRQTSPPTGLVRSPADSFKRHRPFRGEQLSCGLHLFPISEEAEDGGAAAGHQCQARPSRKQFLFQPSDLRVLAENDLFKVVLAEAPPGLYRKSLPDFPAK